MTKTNDLLVDAFSRIRGTATSAVAGLNREQLEARIDPGANTIAWLLWHLARGQDAQIADVAGSDQVWIADGWADRFALPFPATATGYGHSAEEVAAVKGVSGELLVGYLDAVCDRSTRYVTSLSDTDLERIVDERWDPPVTLSARLVSIISDNLQHAGQAALIRGSLLRRA
jgi:hypothetical protein